MYAVVRGELILGSGWTTPRPRPWVARLGGLDARWGFQREFVRGVYDYSIARRSGSRGIYLYFFLSPGLYEIYYPTSWRRDKRYFARVTEAGDVIEISKDEVIECLRNGTSASAS